MKTKIMDSSCNTLCSVQLLSDVLAGFQNVFLFIYHQVGIIILPIFGAPQHSNKFYSVNVMHLPMVIILHHFVLDW